MSLVVWAQTYCFPLQLPNFKQRIILLLPAAQFSAGGRLQAHNSPIYWLEYKSASNCRLEFGAQQWEWIASCSLYLWANQDAMLINHSHRQPTWPAVTRLYINISIHLSIYPLIHPCGQLADQLAGFLVLDLFAFFLPLWTLCLNRWTDRWAGSLFSADSVVGQTPNNQAHTSYSGQLPIVSQPSQKLTPNRMDQREIGFPSYLQAAAVAVAAATASCHREGYRSNWVYQASLVGAHGSIENERNPKSHLRAPKPPEIHCAIYTFQKH